MLNLERVGAAVGLEPILWVSSRSRLRVEMVGCCLTGVDKILMSPAGASIDEREAGASAVGPPLAW